MRLKFATVLVSGPLPPPLQCLSSYLCSEALINLFCLLLERLRMDQCGVREVYLQQTWTFTIHLQIRRMERLNFTGELPNSIAGDSLSISKQHFVFHQISCVTDAAYYGYSLTCGCVRYLGWARNVTKIAKNIWSESVRLKFILTLCITYTIQYILLQDLQGVSAHLRLYAALLQHVSDEKLGMVVL